MTTDPQARLDAHWLVYSRQHNCFWRATANGYTQNVGDAGRYTLDEALLHCGTRDQQRDGTASELAVAAPEVVARLEAALAELNALSEQNADLRRMTAEEDVTYGEALDNQAFVMLSHVASRLDSGDPDLMRKWQAAWESGKVQEGFRTPNRGAAAWIAREVNELMAELMAEQKAENARLRAAAEALRIALDALKEPADGALFDTERAAVRNQARLDLIDFCSGQFGGGDTDGEDVANTLIEHIVALRSIFTALS